MAARGIFDTERFVTAEAVEVELPAASLPLRMVSGIIDLLVVAAGVLILLLVTPFELFGRDAALGQAFGIVVMALVMAGLPITLETLLHGRTVGKLVMGLRTVRDDTGPIGLRHATIRALAGTVELWMTLGGLALLVAATNERARRIGDLLAGTYVVRERVRLRLVEPPEPSPQLAAWAGGADIGVIPDALLVAVRQFLLRAPGLTAEARASTGPALAGAVLERVAPPPPGGAHPEDVLAAVLAERRRRDEDRLDRADALRARLLPPG
ncbi:RDD family protein [Ornithinimicrobium avium]|uniref:RDD family protein n=1 Tax=Ornithinimicrobium avium TaxID=2283195 RepID=A0A345NRR3_9MICO|nr:RDD family protein [Ornithinimicrobium avium]AXH97721.1 RDD family protein [Ornithinimicrobium avium]